MQHKLEFEKEFRPHQFAVGTSASGGKLSRAAQTYIQTQDAVGHDADGPLITHTLLSLDCRNAFNEISRQRIMDELAVKHPAMIAFFWQFYGTAAPLWYTMEGGRVETIYSPADAEFRTISLVLRLDKCHAWSPHWRSAADLPTAITSRGVRASTKGIILLSAPIGTPAFIERTVNEVVAKHQRLLDAVVAFAVDDWDHAVQGANPSFATVGPLASSTGAAFLPPPRRS
ncbi:unnamed protein product [Vitrella brassicaformis CCMP3155]|uniref:Reverse transcriptase domain-containing protein n=1 Tax=Vitrella brassicaformis (strain CCMP3155) TaxID=1169540 RepID=A0A0G4GL63_VITBC|nr:unnamed protein product [Vitrella brassicaformis CCMP3155]|eukprot:CEM30769.1 unnamed protein product [Vitrella brassicaformis CCMP3155]